MRVVDLIEKKRDGGVLSQAEIQAFIDGYTAGDIPDYQASALLMAIFLRGMTKPEIVDLTVAMAHSGETLDLSDISDYWVDKHSSGGVGDKTSLVVLPLVAACGVPIAKMSGRGLGFSGGTLDKLEAIAGYNVDLTGEQFRELARKNHMVLAGQSASLAPADAKLYALRDVTATVQSLPLIASSIMSKKIAAGANGIVLDVKYGRGAFMADAAAARALAQMMVDIGVGAGRDVIACISNMNQPLGNAIGNALEVREAIMTLRGNATPPDFREHCLVIAGYMLKLAGRGTRWTDDEETRALLIEKLDGGEALRTFRGMVEAQGGDVNRVDDPELLPKSRIVEPYRSLESGVIAEIAADQAAWAAFELGAGREKKGDSIDLAVGIDLCVKVGTRVQAGQALAIIHANDINRIAACRERLDRTFTFSADPVEPPPLFDAVISSR